MAQALLYYALFAACTVYIFFRFALRSSLSRVPGPPNASWFLGNVGQMVNKNAWSFHTYLFETFGGVVRIRWLLSRDSLFITDPLALHYVLVKEVYNFEEPETIQMLLRTVLGDNLISSAGEQHRKQRKMLNPLFSMKHMRSIQPVLHPVTKEITAGLVKDVEAGPKEVDVLKIMTRAALEYLGRGALGTTFGPLDDERATAHSDAVSQLGPAVRRISHLQMFLPFLSNVGSPAFRRKVVELLPIQGIHDTIKTVDTLHNEAVSVVNKRREALRKGEAGHDVLSVLVKANMEADAEDKLTDEEVYGQVNLFIIAGQDTTSNALSRILNQLAHHPEAQTRLRDEIREARRSNDGTDFDYDTLNNLPYLDAVCRETLRLYSPASTVQRAAQRDTVLPLAWPIKSTIGQTLTEIPIKKGTHFLVSIYCANRSTKIWGPDAEEWKPERWLKPLPASVTDARLPGVYSNMMTFLAGGRACIGFKFSEMEMKLVLSSMIEKLVFEPGPPVSWQMIGASRPVVVGDEDAGAKLPLRVSLAPPS